MAVVPGALGPAIPDEPRALTRGVSHPLAFFISRRVATGLVTLIVVSILIFLATNILPGNAAVVVLGRNATPARVQALDAKLGIKGSAASRYVRWLGDAVQGNLGRSAVAEAEGRPNSAVASTLGDPLRNSFVLAALTTLLLIPLTLVLGAVAGIFAGRRLDHAISLPALVMGGLPEFVMGTLLIYVFFNQLGLLPPVALLSPGESPFSNPEALVLPVLTLLAVAVGAGVRQVRAGMAEVLQQDY